MPSPQSADLSLFQDYAPPEGVYDEWFDESQEPRPHWERLIRHLRMLGGNEFARRWEQAQRLVHENGIAYSAFVTPKNKPRPWLLDAIPLLIPGDQWSEVAVALEQRARLLNLVLRDLHGERKLLHDNVLPAELVYLHPGFLPALHGQQLSRGMFLHFYAADLARSADGEWWVLADRTEAPSGLGYSLENRIVISRLLPDAFRTCRVRRLAPYFIAAQQTLRELAPQHRDNPRVVILSQGPKSLNYFEDAYLARYLGYLLVEGGDLTVREGRVWLKTLGGLLPVDVIVRRQNSLDSDSLELDADSPLAVPGLTQAVRCGNVAIANALGSGLVESPVMMAFMPLLCQTLLGEDLKMPGVATWWCGDERGRAYVLDNLDGLVVKPAFRRRGHDEENRARLDKLSLDELAAAIRREPAQYVGQEQLRRSCAPVWRQGGRTAHIALRGYAVASGDRYEVMHGGLARLSASPDPLDVSIRKGEGSKDVWILSDTAVQQVSLLELPGQPIDLRRSGAELPSRVADNVFWLGRNVERADAAARLLRTTATLLTGETRNPSDVEIVVLLRALAAQGQIEPGFAVDSLCNQLPAIEEALPESVFDETHSGSLRSTLNEIYRLGSILRDRISIDSWRTIHRIDEQFQLSSIRATDLSDLMSMSNQLIIDLAAFNGIVMGSMTRAQAYRFLQLGRRLERALQIVGLVKSCLIPLPKALGAVLETVLEISDSVMTYRSRYLSNLQLASVLDLVLTDETNPRSLAFQLVRLLEHVEQLPREHTQATYSPEQRVAMSLVHSIRMVDIQVEAELHSLGDQSRLERLTKGWEAALPELSEAISHRYLVHTGPAHQLSRFRTE